MLRIYSSATTTTTQKLRHYFSITAPLLIDQCAGTNQSLLPSLLLLYHAPTEAKLNMLLLDDARKGLNKIPRDQMWCFMYLLFVLAVCALTGCGMNGIEPSFASEVSMVEQPADKIFLGSISLERYGASDKHPSFIVFTRDGKELLKETAKPQENLAIISIPIDRVDGRILPSAAEKGRGHSGKQNFLFNLAADGVPAVVVERQKASGAFDYEVFRLSKKIEKIATIANGYSRIQMQTTDVPGCYEIMANDWFSNLGARAIAPEVLLTYRSGELRLDVKAMQKPAPGKKQLALMRKTIRAEFGRKDDGVPAQLAAQVLDLYYSGNAKQARTFFDSAWAGTNTSKEKYWHYLMTEAARSPYWTDVLAMNNSVDE